MQTKIIEASSEGNWGKFMVGRFDDADYARRSVVDTETTKPLLRQIGWGPDLPYYLVLDLQTGEGAVFRLGGLASADLHTHEIWVCPLFEPFLTWLYDQWQTATVKGGDAWWQSLPEHVALPHAPFAFYGYRRKGTRRG